MRKFLFVILVNICILSHAQVNISEADISRYHGIITQIINNFSGIMRNDGTSEVVYNAYYIADSAIRNNAVSFQIDGGLDSVLSGMFFSYSQSGEISLIFGIKYLETYSPGSSIHYSILIHEYRHLHDYLLHTEYFKSAVNDEKVKYRFELDALRIEAEFIKHYLLGKYNLSYFEEYILNSFERDNLNSASTVILKECMECFFLFNYLENSYFENEISKAQIIGILAQEGRNVLNRYYSASGEFALFFHFIEVSTFRKYMIRTIIAINDNPWITWGELFAQYPEIQSIYNNMSDVLDTERERQAVYLSDIYQHWEHDITGN